jgi:hypothetical protein
MSTTTIRQDWIYVALSHSTTHRDVRPNNDEELCFSEVIKTERIGVQLNCPLQIISTTITSKATPSLL